MTERPRARKRRDTIDVLLGEAWQLLRRAEAVTTADERGPLAVRMNQVADLLRPLAQATASTDHGVEQREHAAAVIEELVYWARTLAHRHDTAA